MEPEHESKRERDGDHGRRMDLIVVVSGVPVHLHAIGQEQVERLVKQALNKSGNQGQSPEGWELRTEDGRLIDQNQTVHAAGLSTGQTLFLSPSAGIGG